MINSIEKTETFKTIKTSIQNWDSRLIEASNWFEKNKNNIHTSRQEAIELYMLGVDCSFNKPKNR